MKSKPVFLFFVVVFFTSMSYAQEVIEPSSGAWSIEYKKGLFPSSRTLTVESVYLEEENGLNITFNFLCESGLFFFSHEKGAQEYCGLVSGKDVKEKLAEIYLNPVYIAVVLKVMLEKATTEYLKKNPGGSFDDPEWVEIAARVEAETRAYFENRIKPFIQQTIVIDTNAENEIALLGNNQPWLYSKVGDPKKLRSSMASMQTLAKKIIMELKESKKLSESTQKELDALTGLMPEQYGMKK